MQNKTVVITGTSRGIGKELALLFAKNGYEVISLSRKIAPEFEPYRNIKSYSVDLSSEADLNLFSEEINKLETIDFLINNAGSLINKPFESLTKSDFQNVYEVNVFGVVALTQICIPKMRKGSHVVTISSMGGIQGSIKFSGLAAYSSSKGAIITLSELLAEEYKEKEISFNVLALGAVNTEMLQEAFPGYHASTSALEMANYIYEFTINGSKFYNGKVLQVSASTP